MMTATTYGNSGLRSKWSIVYHSLCFIATLLLATACGYDHVISPDEYKDEEKTPYVEIRIAVPLANPYSTRANPMGGEEGNGRERGVLNEDKVHDINVFFYKHEDGMDADDAEIDYQLFYNIQNPNDGLNTQIDSIGESDTYFGEKYYILKLKYWKNGDISETKGMNFLAVANAGAMGKIKTLKALKDYNFAGENTWQKTYDAYSKNASNMDYFLMSTAYNKAYTYSGLSTGDNTIREGEKGEYSGVTTLQRMYARLDLWYNESDNAVVDESGKEPKVTELKYQVVDSDKKPIKDENNEVINHTVYLTNVLPVNVMQRPSFLFKKVTHDLTSFTLSDLKGCSAFSWGGKESPSEGPYSTTSDNDRPTNYVMERHTIDKNSDGTDGNFDEWYGQTATAIVGATGADSETGNGIMNQKNGKLSGYYHGKPASKSDPDYGCDRIAIISYANENTHPTDCFHSNYLTGMAFRAVYVPQTIYSGYGEVAEGEKTVKKPLPLAWKEGDDMPATIYRYSPSDNEVLENRSLYFSSETAANDYAKDHPEDSAVITAYSAQEHNGKVGFVCYYNLWLRHYNNENADPQLSYPMEYATVRNNIYRVRVTFSGPGDPTPTMREPDTMQARIFVRKWNMRQEEKPLDF